VRADDYQKRLRLGDTLLAPAAATGVTLTPAGEAVVLEISAP
jgi:hypothetical protein